MFSFGSLCFVLFLLFKLAKYQKYHILWNTIWMEQKVWNPKNQLTPQVLFCADEKPA